MSGRRGFLRLMGLAPVAAATPANVMTTEEVFTAWNSGNELHTLSESPVDPYYKKRSEWYRRLRERWEPNWNPDGIEDVRVKVIKSYSPTYRAIKTTELRRLDHEKEQTLARTFFGNLFDRWLDD